MTIRKMIGAAALMGVMASANAASISLVYSGGGAIDVDGAILAFGGDTVSFDVVYDFSDAATLGGGYDIIFDASGLEYNGDYQVTAGDPGFGRAPDDLGGGLLESAAFGDFNGVGGTGVAGTFSMTVTGGAGDYVIELGDTGGIAGPFIDAATFGVIPVDYSGATVRVVPVPAAVWFMLSGLGALIGFGRRKAA